MKVNIRMIYRKKRGRGSRMTISAMHNISIGREDAGTSEQQFQCLLPYKDYPSLASCSYIFRQENYRASFFSQYRHFQEFLGKVVSVFVLFIMSHPYDESCVVCSVSCVEEDEEARTHALRRMINGGRRSEIELRFFLPETEEKKCQTFGRRRRYRANMRRRI